MTDEQCIAILAAIITATDCAREDAYYAAKRQAENGYDWPDPEENGDPIARARQLLAKAKGIS